MRAVRVDLGILMLCYIGGSQFFSGLDPGALVAFFGVLLGLVWVSRGGVFWVLLCLLFAVTGAWRWNRVHGWKPKLGAVETLNGVVAVLVDNPSRRTASWRADVEVIYVLESDHAASVQRKRGGALLYFSLEDSLAPALRWGDTLILREALRPLSAPLNPGAFDYAKYQWKRGVFYSAFVPKENWERAGCYLGRVPRMVWMRDSIRSFVYRALPDSTVADVTMGFMLGNRSEIDPTAIQAFSVAGAMHVMAVSGLHVGLVYVLLQMLFPISALRAPGVLLGVWFYAGITGFSSSAIRASTMLSFLLIGKMSKKKTAGHQTLFLAAFILLFMDPLQWRDLGFQLSFAAVGGILLFQPLFQKLYDPTTPWKRWLWGLITVSVAAQAATWPLSAQVFHIFPSYFLLTNLWIIPMVTLLLYSGLILLGIHGFVWPLDTALAFWSRGVRAMVQGVEWVGGLPGASVDGIVFNEVAVLWSYILMASAYFVLVAGKWRSPLLLLTYTVLVGWVVHRANHREQLQLVQCVFYSDRKLQMVGVVGNREEELVLFSDTVVSSEKYDYTVQSHWKSRGVRRHYAVQHTNGGIEVGGCNITPMHPGRSEYPLPAEGAFHIMYWAGKWKWLDPDWLANCRANLWIIHPSVPPWNLRELVEYCEAQDQAYHLLVEGALTVDLDLDSGRPVHPALNRSRP